MTEKTVVTGQASAWQLLKKVGEGDAGEIYLVRSMVDSSHAILKRPQRSAFTADVLRQANQIASEGKILKSLRDFRVKLQYSQVSIPVLLDHAKPEFEDTADYFIVLEKAGGVDLLELSKFLHLLPEHIDEILKGHDPKDAFYLRSLFKKGELPEYVFLRCLDSVIALFEEIHRFPIDLDGVEKTGVIWNDVKPEHIFWDFENARCTVIDWGNAQFLEADGTTRDRLFTSVTDYLQFFDSFGKFLRNSFPTLHKQLKWVSHPISVENYYQEVRNLSERVEQMLAVFAERVQALRKREETLTQSENIRVGQIKDLEKIHQDLFSLGEMPDFDKASQAAERFAKNLVTKQKFVELRWLAAWAKNLPVSKKTQWQVLAVLSDIGAGFSEETRKALIKTIDEGLQGDWHNTLWHLLVETHPKTETGWYYELSQLLRQIQLDIHPTTPTPLESLLQFQSLLEGQIKPGEKRTEQGEEVFLQATGFIGTNEKNRLFIKWYKQLQQEIVPRWSQVEPDPPHAGLDYNEVTALARDMGKYYPQAEQKILRIVYQPEAQVRILLDAWERKDFQFIARGLKRLLLWDPERWRVLTAEGLVLKTQEWLDRLAEGPRESESLQDYAVRHEVLAREIRNRVGSSSWLERILGGLKDLRQGKRADQVLRESQDIVKEMPWLKFCLQQNPVKMPALSKIEVAKEIFSPVSLERKPKNRVSDQMFVGYCDTTFGFEGDMVLSEPLDAWKPEAQGSSARVFQGFVKLNNGSLKQRAIKIMRPDQVDYATPLFEEEVRILNILRDVPGITPLLEFGFIRLDCSTEERVTIFNRPESMKGQLYRFGWNYLDEFLQQMPQMVQDGWLPYLAMEKKNFEDNLLMLCDAGHTQGNLLRVDLALLIAIQICDIIIHAHRNQIVYRDHKILHYYWLPVYNGVFMIDWNVAKLYARPLTESERQFDLVQFGARALHHILTGRPAPGALPLGPTRPEEIEKASQQYNVAWSFDDQRLSIRTKEILENTLKGFYNNAEYLKQDLQEEFNALRREHSPGETDRILQGNNHD